MLKIISVGVAALVLAAPATAQTRGTAEFGAFGSRTSFGSGLGVNMNAGWGFGGRGGVFITPSLSFEFEGGATKSPRPFGLQDVTSSVLTARLLAEPIRIGRLRLLAGGGIDHTDTYVIESYGAHGLLGAKFAINNSLALRVDGIYSHMSNGGYNNKVLHFGLASYRSPRGFVTTNTNTVYRDVVGPTIAQRPDSVSAAETRRLRASEASYRELRDSLNRYVPASSAAALATMQEMIYFERDVSELSDSAKAILREKVVVFKANPAMRIVITGFASQPGTELYNFALGRQRADAAKAYLVSLGVDQGRIEVSTKGEGDQATAGSSFDANADNRRGQFRILIADPYLKAPKKP